MAGLLATAVPVSAAAPSLPALDGGSAAIQDQDERKLGEVFLRKLRAGSPVMDDPLLQAWAEDLGYRLAFHAGMPQPDLQIVLIPDRRINAFAVPGGIIGINAGLFLYADNESEFAAVLAHELAHVQQRHYARSVAASSQDQWLYLGALLASIALAAGSGGDAGMALGATAQAAMIQQQLAYSRLHEREADRIGMQTLTTAGYSPMAMPEFFGRLERESRQVGFMPEFLLTHPLTQERIADSLSRARTLPAGGQADSKAYRLARFRLMSLLSRDDEQTVGNWRRQLQDNPAAEEARFGLSLALKNQRQFEQARREMDVLLTAQPATVDYVVARADIELADNRPEQALQLLRQALTLTPDSTPLRLYAAHAAIQCLQGDLAIGWLEPLSRLRPMDPVVWELMSEAHLQRKDSIGVLRSRAEVRFLTGQGEKSLKDLEQSIRLAQGNYPLQAKLQERLNRMKEMLAEERKMD